MSGRPHRRAVAALMFKSLVLKPLHLDSLQLYQEHPYNVEEEEKEKEKAKKSQLWQRHNPADSNIHHYAQTSILESQRANSQKALRQLTNDGSGKHRKRYLYGLPDGLQHGHHNRHGKEQNLIDGQQQQRQQQQQQHKPGAIVLPQNRIMTQSHHIAERIKDSRLNGADLYVARLGRVRKEDHSDCGCQGEKSIATEGATLSDTDSEPTGLAEPSKAKPLTGSLHEELRFPSPSEEKSPTPQSVCKSERLTATYSRPCYRCISYMHSAGIKRVFWTNHQGQWEGGKVRELVDALEGSASPSGVGLTGVSGGGPVYVTKSEVLLLKGLK